REPDTENRQRAADPLSPTSPLGGDAERDWQTRSDRCMIAGLSETPHLMKRNRKKTETCRFNGYPHKDSRSIHSVAIVDLESRSGWLEAKLADPNDADDKRWTQRWLDRHRAELAKKQQGLSLKTAERAKSRARRSPY